MATRIHKAGNYIRRVLIFIPQKLSDTDTIQSLMSINDTCQSDICSYEKIQSIGGLTVKPSDLLSKLMSFIKKTILSNLEFPKLKLTKTNLPLIWGFSSLILFILYSIAIVVIPWKAHPPVQNKYNIYLASPLVLKNINYEIYSKDSRAQRVNAVFKDYRCPLEGLGEVFVYEADKYNIPWWLTAAMSFQESSCGKMTPEPNGMESYNAWGWAVYGDNVQSFDNWVRGVETVSAYMSDRFYSKGVTDLCVIMKTYTPPSNGSWCRGVEHFGQEIQNFESQPKNL